MLQDRVVEVAMTKIFLSRPFTVPKRDSPMDRLVVDQSVLNKYIRSYRFRMVTIAQVSLHPPKDMYLASQDLGSEYWHIPTHP